MKSTSANEAPTPKRGRRVWKVLLSSHLISDVDKPPLRLKAADVDLYGWALSIHFCAE